MDVVHDMFSNLYKHYYDNKHQIKIQKNYELGRLVFKVMPSPVVRVNIDNYSHAENKHAEIVLNSFNLGGGKGGLICGLIRYKLRHVQCSLVELKTTLTDEEIKLVNSNKFDSDYYCNLDIILNSMLNCRDNYDINNLRFIYDLVGSINNTAIYQFVFAALAYYTGEIAFNTIKTTDHTVLFLVTIQYDELIIFNDIDAEFDVISVVYTEVSHRANVDSIDDEFFNVYGDAIYDANPDSAMGIPRERRTADFMKLHFDNTNLVEKVDLIAERKLKILFIDTPTDHSYCNGK